MATSPEAVEPYIAVYRALEMRDLPEHERTRLIILGHLAGKVVDLRGKLRLLQEDGA